MCLPNSRGDVKNDVDLFDKKSPFVCFDSQARQLTVAADGDDFVTEFGVVAFNVVE
jgi:hypothetical protein